MTRRRIVEAALALFLERGFAAATVEAIARDAGVAPATVYQAFGSKPAVLEAVLDVALAGDSQPVAILERDWVRATRRDPDPRRRLVRIVRHTTEIAARSAAIKEVIRDAAATEPGIRDLIRGDDERRRRTQQALVEVILGDQAPSRRVARRAADTFFALVTSDAHTLVVGRLGWSMAGWRRWLVRILEREILGTGSPGAVRRPRLPGRPGR